MNSYKLELNDRNYEMHGPMALRTEFNEIENFFDEQKKKEFSFFFF